MSYPILYPSTETEFASNGIGILSDAISCTVTEERNGPFELEMQYPMDGLHFDALVQRALILARPNQTANAQPYRIYRITKPLNGVVTVYAQHISYDLTGVVADPFTAASAPAAMAALQSGAVNDNTFVFWTDKTTAAVMTVAVPTSVRALLGGVEGSVLDTYGGEYEFDRYTVRLYGQRGQDRGVTIRYGKNLLSLEQEENCSGVYTGVYPYWANAESGELVRLPEKIVPAGGAYDFSRILPMDFSAEWQEAPTEAQLRSRAQAYVKANTIGVPSVSLSLSFAQLEQTEEYKGMALLERVSLCDTVHVEFARLGVSATAKAIKIVYNVLLDRIDSVDLGDARASLADTIAGQQQQIERAPEQTKTFLQQAVDRATSQITGNLGGYVVMHSSAGGKEPDEILVMDTPDITTAAKVWRWNKSGLGYSGTGYNGPYGLAMTQDGQIVADYVNTGTMNAAIIRAGILQSIDGDAFYLDLEKGILRGNFDSLSIASKTVETQEGAKSKASAAQAAAEQAATAYTDDALKDYPTTVTTQSMINQKADEIKLQVDGKIDSTQAQSLIDTSIKGITLSVSNSGASSTLTLKSGSTTLSSASITLTGVVTFADLSTSGKTTINGDNITTGTIRCSLLQGTMDKTNCYWNTSTGEFRSGTSNGSRIDISPGTINQYYQNYLTGIFHSVYGKTYIGCNSDLLFLGWFSGGQPSVDAQNKGDGNFTGIWMQHVNGSAYGWIHCAADRFEIPGRIECGSLSVSGREI